MCTLFGTRPYTSGSAGSSTPGATPTVGVSSKPGDSGGKSGDASGKSSDGAEVAGAGEGGGAEGATTKESSLTGIETVPRYVRM